MKLVTLTDEFGLFHIEASGSIAFPDVEPRNPLDLLLGPGCYRYKIVLNLEKATYMDTAGVSWLLRCHQACAEEGGCFVIHSIPPMVEQILHLLRMREVLHLAEDEAKARAIARGVPV